MGLKSALVDRARRVSNVTSGTDQTMAAKGNWFRARLISSPVFTDDEGAIPPQRQALRGASASSKLWSQLTYAKTDENGEMVELEYGNLIEVRSPELGNSTWLIENRPLPIRKKRAVIGFTAVLAIPPIAEITVASGDGEGFS